MILNNADFDYEHFFHLSPDLVCIAGFNGYFKNVNPAVHNLLQYSYEELYSRPINDFIHPDDRKKTSEARRNIHNRDTLLNFENRYITKGGDVVWLEWTSEPLPDDQLVFAIAKNITHKKRLENERIELIEKLSAVNRDLNQFNLTVSHDLRSPLSSLMTIFDLLDTSKISDRYTVELIEILKLTGCHLKDTLNTYVDFLSEKVVRNEALEMVDLKQTLEKVEGAISALISSSHTQIRADFSKLPVVRFTPAHLESIFMNLITNSIKYSKEGHSPEINISSFIKNNIPAIVFEDNGRGMDMCTIQNRIFQINETFHVNNDSKGVGLYLIKSHLKKMGGDITVESEVGVGSTFTITLQQKNR